MHISLRAFLTATGAVLGLTILAVLWDWSPVVPPWPVEVASAQGQYGKYAVVTRVDGGTPSVQFVVKIDNSVTPTRLEVGCDNDQLNGTSLPGNSDVNGFRITGNAAGSGPTVKAIGCVNGDTNVPFNLDTTGTGGYNLKVAGTNEFVIDNTGQVTTGFLGARTDIQTVYSAMTYCHFSAAVTATRVAANNWVQRTGASLTQNVGCDLPAPYRTTSGKGYKLTAFSIAQGVTGAALTSNTFNGLSTVTYANNVANAVAAYGGTITITMPTAIQTNPYVTAATVGTPAFNNSGTAAVNLDWTAVTAVSGVYDVYGILATWTVQD